MTYKEIYNEGLEKLNETIPENPDRKLDARLLLEAACGTTVETLLADGDRPVTQEEREKYFGFIGRRAAHEPVAYILGEQDFMGLPFAVTPDVLIPNQDTENLVEEAMKVIHDGWRILDLCTGSGCILLSLLHYSNDTIGIGTDLSQKALAVAGKNASELGLSDRVQWLQGDLYEALENPADGAAAKSAGTASRDPAEGINADPAGTGLRNPDSPEEKKAGRQFEMIISNPPYIPTGVIPTLMPEVGREEPMMALDGGEDGLDFYRRIINGADKYLVHGGLLLFETGFDEAGEVAELMKRADFLEVSIYKDYGGQDRVVRGERE